MIFYFLLQFFSNLSTDLIKDHVGYNPSNPTKEISKHNISNIFQTSFVNWIWKKMLRMFSANITTNHIAPVVRTHVAQFYAPACARAVDHRAHSCQANQQKLYKTLHSSSNVEIDIKPSHTLH